MRILNKMFEYRGVKCAMALHWCDYGENDDLPTLYSSRHHTYRGYIDVYVELCDGMNSYTHQMGACMNCGRFDKGVPSYVYDRFPMFGGKLYGSRVIGWDYRVPYRTPRVCDIASAYSDVKRFVDYMLDRLELPDERYHVIGKYHDNDEYYRQERIFKDYGINVR